MFLLFYGEKYYPEGGSGDFIGRFTNREEAISAISPYCDWAEIYDIEANKWEDVR